MRPFLWRQTALSFQGALKNVENTSLTILIFSEV